MKKVVKKGKSLDVKVDKLARVVDVLAISVAKGFEKLEAKMNNGFKNVEKKLATKADLSTQKTQGDVLQAMLKEIEAVHQDSKSFRENISTLYTDHVGYDRKINNLTVRVEKLELKK